MELLKSLVQSVDALNFLKPKGVLGSLRNDILLVVL